RQSASDCLSESIIRLALCFGPCLQRSGSRRCALATWKNGPLDAIDPFAAGVFTDFLQLLLQILEYLGDFHAGLLKLVHGVRHRNHGGIMTAAAYGTAEIANVGNRREKAAVKMLDEIADTLFRVRELLPQGHAANRPLDHHNASSTVCDAWRQDRDGSRKPLARSRLGR